MGKSTLAQMLALYAHSRGALVLEGKYSDDTDSPHTPWADVLRAGLQFVQPEQRASYLGELAETFPGCSRSCRLQRQALLAAPRSIEKSSKQTSTPALDKSWLRFH